MKILFANCYKVWTTYFTLLAKTYTLLGWNFSLKIIQFKNMLRGVRRYVSSRWKPLKVNGWTNIWYMRFQHIRIRVTVNPGSHSPNRVERTKQFGTTTIDTHSPISKILKTRHIPPKYKIPIPLRIHVCYIYLNLVDSSGNGGNIYLSWNLWVLVYLPTIYHKRSTIHGSGHTIIHGSYEIRNDVIQWYKNSLDVLSHHAIKILFASTHPGTFPTLKLATQTNIKKPWVKNEH